MKSFTLAALVGACFLFFSCSSTKTMTAVPSVRTYNATASVGDFLTISLDSTAHTIAYKNYSNGDSGTVPYTVNNDGTYTVTDPAGNLLAAYEVPGFVMVVESAKSGPTHDVPALITAVESVPATIQTFASRNFNYLQFRTSNGGLELGTVSVDSQGDIQHDAYWPFGIMEQPQDFFNGGTFPASAVVEDASGNYFTIHENDGSHDTVFGTQSGFFAVDTGAGAIIGLPKASSKDFNSTNAGTYKAIYYHKVNAQTGQNNNETGTPSQGQANLTISNSGLITITDSQNNQMATGTLTPIADTPSLYDGTNNKLSDPCYGMFTVHVATANSQQDLFATFQGNAIIFSSFATALPAQPGGTYDYFYGVGLK
ncbi:MAG TPA: hypothetical protein VIW67_25590 [Terriglobales bacterium]|jgi:hypothetical protein